MFLLLFILFLLPFVFHAFGFRPNNDFRKYIVSRRFAAKFPMKITFEGEVTAIECSPHETLLEAMERYANLEPLYSCRTGTAIDLLWMSTYSLCFD